MSNIVPLRGSFVHKPWEGDCITKPWERLVTVAIPVYNAAEAIGAAIPLLRLQSLRPHIVLIDTGSDKQERDKLLSYESDDIEVHCLRFRAVRHPSDFPAIAMDLAFSACTTPYMLATHADCFLRSRHVVQDLYTALTQDKPTTVAAGYEITERPHTDWRGMLGHTLTMYDMKAMDRIGAGWSLRRLCNTKAHPDGITAEHSIAPATSPNWPDTELLINYLIREAGLTVKVVGTERNAQRTLDHMIDHCRSVTSAKLYNEGGTYCSTSSQWLASGILEARQRAQDWLANP
jgi:glycosyltransferase involved in cell wall biosynthesis